MLKFLVRGSVVCAVLGAIVGGLSHAAPPEKVSAPPASSPVKVGLPQDARPHDASLIEWWYFNSFLTTESGKKYAVVGSFFRSGFPGQKKGHYLIYALADLSANTRTAYSVLDKANRDLLTSYLSLASMRNPGDPRPLQLLGLLQKGKLPTPHRALDGDAVVRTTPRFSIALGNNRFAQITPDARTWKAQIFGDTFAVDLVFSQTGRPPMLVGGEGKTGIRRPDDMYYLSLTHMETTGTLTQKGVVEKVTGTGWIDRQWGTSWLPQANGWDWFGLQLSDGSEVIVYRVKDNKTGKVLRAEATLLGKNGTQTVETNPVFTPSTEKWVDKQSQIAYPISWTIRLPKSGLTLNVKSVFSDQTIPVIGIGDAIWEGIVQVKGNGKNNLPLTGQGYMELVGYPPTVKGAQ